jgi:hypothetical protein
MELLKSNGLGSVGLKHLKEIREKTMTKWDSVGLLKGLKGHVKENVAQLYENEAGVIITEATDATSSGSFETVVFPIVRRVFSKLLANDIVSVQAMNMPIGKLFFFVPKTSSRYDGAGAYGDPHKDGEQFSAHTSMMNQQMPSCINGDCAKTEFLSKSLYDLYYDDGLFDNSKGKIKFNTLLDPNVQVVVLKDSGVFETVPPATVETASDGTYRKIMIRLSGFDWTGGSMGRDKGRLTGPDGNEMDTEEFLASLKLTSLISMTDGEGNPLFDVDDEIPFRLVTQKYGKGIVSYDQICDADGYLYIEADLTHPQALNATVRTYDGYIGAASGTTVDNTAFKVTYAQYETLEFETEMGEVTFELDEVVVSVTERKLRATWSPELAQDVSAFHNIDAEAELTAMLSEQVAAEIDREILRDLRKGGAWTLRWDYNGWKKASSASNPYTQKEWNQTLVTMINQISAQIHKATLRGGANFIVVSSEISAVFNDLEYFHVSDASAEEDQYNMGIEKIGTLGGRFQVYRDPYAPWYSMIIGHKGKSLLDTGYIYAPYVPLQLTPTMYNPFNFAPVKGIMTRYAKKMVNNRFYGAIRVDGVPHFNVAELR